MADASITTALGQARRDLAHAGAKLAEQWRELAKLAEKNADLAAAGYRVTYGTYPDGRGIAKAQSDVDSCAHLLCVLEHLA